MVSKVTSVMEMYVFDCTTPDYFRFGNKTLFFVLQMVFVLVFQHKLSTNMQHFSVVQTVHNTWYRDYQFGFVLDILCVCVQTQLFTCQQYSKCNVSSQ